jgi:hypothetical protein
MSALRQSQIAPGFIRPAPYQHLPANLFPYTHPAWWLHSHFAVGGWSPLQRLSGMLTAHMTQIQPHAGFTWHPHRGLEIYTWVLDGKLYHEDTTGGKGIIEAGELQRMFAGDYIEHQELNPFDEPARVIQIWYVADSKHRAVAPHYQQVGRSDLPVERIGHATVHHLIGHGSPMVQHMHGRLDAITLDAGGSTTLPTPQPDEDMFFYVTGGTGTARHGDARTSDGLGVYDVLLTSQEAEPVHLTATADSPLHALAFYLPRFLA